MGRNLVIDASNIRKGGGLTHLCEILSHVDLAKFGVSEIIVWGPSSTLQRLEGFGLTLRTHPWIEKGGFWAHLFRRYILDRTLDSSIDLVWAPGGTYLGAFRPYVTMMRNFLPFDSEARDRFRYSVNWLRYISLKNSQLRSFRNAGGLIHVSRKAHDVIRGMADLSDVRQAVVYHGLNERFRFAPRPQRPLSSFTAESPAKILYVSTINLYKHQDQLVLAVDLLRRKGNIHVQLDLVGSATQPAYRRLKQLIRKLDPNGEWVFWHGEIPYDRIQEFYTNADVYACMSSCETFGMILLEAMAAGLPVLCSDRSALPEIHLGACASVDPEDPESIALELEAMLRNHSKREMLALAAWERSKFFTWEKCADETFGFLVDVMDDYQAGCRTNLVGRQI